MLEPLFPPDYAQKNHYDGNNKKNVNKPSYYRKGDDPYEPKYDEYDSDV